MSGWSAADAIWLASIAELITPELERWFGEAFLAIARVATISDQPFREAHIEQVASRLRLFPAEQFEEIRPELAEAISEGEGIDQVRDRISAVLNFDETAGSGGEQAATRRVQARINEVERLLEDPRTPPEDMADLRAERSRLYPELYRLQNRWAWKARRIARTEVISALNGGSFAGATARAEETGETLYKEWLATDDVRTREEHREADGQVRPMAMPFLVGGFPLQFPGDPTAPGHLTINCRCATAYLDEDELTDEQLDQLTTPEPGISAAGGHAMADEENLPTGWRGVMGPLDVPTGDGRILATPPDGVRFREGTLPIMWQRETGMGHDGSVIAARVDRAWVEEVSGRSVVMGEGPFDLGGEDGREAARLLHEGFLTGLSIDPDEVTVEWVLQDRQGQRVDPAGMDEDEVWDGLESGELTEVMVMTDWRLMGATLTPFPAFDEARIEPIYDYEPAAGAMAASGEPFTGRVSEVVTPHPAEHYTDPELDRLTPLTVTDDGRVVGHIAGFSECHLSYGEDVCVTAPRSPSGYAYFHLGEVRLDTGDTLAVGKLTLGGGHADPSLGYRAAIEHYDDVATAIAAVRAGEDAYGVWVSGHLLAGVTPEQVERFMLCPPSGDWRRIGGQLELVAACSVNVPGFPNVRAASGQAGQLSLVAAGARQVRRAARRPRPSATVDTRRLAAEVAKELRAMDRRTARAQEIAARIGR